MQEQEAKILNTLYFGELEVPDENIINFKDGLLGFENLNKYVLVTDEDSDPIKWLLSVDEPSIGFPIIDPWYIYQNYNPGKSIDSDKDAVFCVVTLGNEDRNMTANLKAPVIIDIIAKEGKQIILPSEKYPPNFEIKSTKGS